MLCIRKGCYANIVKHRTFLYGAAFILPGRATPSALVAAAELYGDSPVMSAPDYLVLRVVAANNSHEGNPINLTVHVYHEWFDFTNGDAVPGGATWTPASTMIAVPNTWDWLGYDGEKLS